LATGRGEVDCAKNPKKKKEKKKKGKEKKRKND